MEHDRRRMWERLLTYLDEWATAREVPGGIEVAYEQSPGSSRTVTVFLTPVDWEQLLGTALNTDDPTRSGIRATLMAMPPEHAFLLYDTYDFVSSPTRVPPPDPMDDVDFSDGGEWVAVDRSGKITSRFSDWPDEH